MPGSKGGGAHSSSFHLSRVYSFWVITRRTLTTPRR
jgi:hypothetical protein